jgi:hypothetical protein
MRLHSHKRHAVGSPGLCAVEASLAAAVVATDSTSVNANYDNGTTLSRMRGYRTYYERGPHGTLTHTGHMTQNVRAGKGKCVVRQTTFGEVPRE